MTEHGPTVEEQLKEMADEDEEFLEMLEIFPRPQGLHQEGKKTFVDEGYYD